MACTQLYELLRQLSEGGREVAARQQGLDGDSAAAEVAFVMLPHHVHIVEAFAQASADQGSAWQGMPQAGISLTDVARYRRSTQCLVNALQR